MKLIHPAIISKFLSVILLVEAISVTACIPVALFYNESIYPFIITVLTELALSFIFYLPGRKANLFLANIRDYYLFVSLGWLIISVTGSAPYIISSSTESLIDAMFETTSGFTTTGASILTDVETLPRSILFWRSLTHWIGGFGIIAMVILIFPTFRTTGYRMFGLESSLKEKIQPKTTSTILRLLFIYLGLTFAEVFLLWFGDMDLFESLCHAFGTVATGGFSTRNAGLAYYSAYSQYVVMIFMFLSGISQVVYYYLVKLNFKKVKRNDELFFYLAVIIISGTIATSILISFSGKTFETAFREGFFQAVSIITCTGFANADYLLWPAPGMMLLFLLMFAGGCTGSTSGGIKMARHLIVLKNIKNIFIKLTHPESVTTVKFNGNSLTEKSSNSVMTFILVYLFIFFLGTIILVINGSDLLTSASSTATCMAGIGPGMSTVGPMSNYEHLNAISKITLSILMILGRLEIFTFIVIFSRSFWKE
ncbi:MAG TPA: TrkH family potassium uptake protein [Bacteroidales bacterium]|nr:TrkH family potassium uptake protein [Bacteroidales bacterium]